MKNTGGQKSRVTFPLRDEPTLAHVPCPCGTAWDRRDLKGIVSRDGLSTETIGV
jgi:hypothetical protein